MRDPASCGETGGTDRGLVKDCRWRGLAGKRAVSKGAGHGPGVLRTWGPDRPGFESWHASVFKGRPGQI